MDDTVSYKDRLLQTLEDDSDVYFLTDSSGRVLNSNLDKLRGYRCPFGKTRNVSVYDLVTEDSVLTTREFFEKTRSNGEAECSMVLRGENDLRVPLTSKSHLFINKRGKRTRLVIIQANVTRADSRDTEFQSRPSTATDPLTPETSGQEITPETSQLTLDPLTGLPNRLALTQQKLESGSSKTIFVISLNNFKQINFRFGWQAGDTLLKKIAWKIKFLLSESDALFRLSGPEFALLKDIGDAGNIHEVARNILDTVNSVYEINYQAFRVTCGIGVATPSEDSLDVNSLIDKASIALSTIHEDNLEYQVYNPAMSFGTYRNIKKAHQLRHAIQTDTDQIQVFYQPIADLNNQAAGAEALVRWDHPELGMLLPSEFLPLAEESGLMLPLTRVILDKVCLKLKQWEKPFPFISINISEIDLLTANFPEIASSIVESHNLSSERIRFEVGGSLLCDTSIRVQDAIKNLRKQGFKLMFDRFNRSNTNLSQLSSFPEGSTLKIDSSYITNPSDETVQVNLIKAMVQFALSSNTQVIIEGVESAEHMPFFRSLGSPFIQGFAFSEPLSSNEFERCYIQT